MNTEPTTLPDLNNRIGRFYINHRFYRDNEKLRLVRQILSNFVVIRCEHVFHRGGFEYLAYAEFFDKLDDGAQPADYVIEIIQDNLHRTTTMKVQPDRPGPAVFERVIES